MNPQWQIFNIFDIADQEFTLKRGWIVSSWRTLVIGYPPKAARAASDVTIRTCAFSHCTGTLHKQSLRLWQPGGCTAPRSAFSVQNCFSWTDGKALCQYKAASTPSASSLWSVHQSTGTGQCGLYLVYTSCCQALLMRPIHWYMFRCMENLGLILAFIVTNRKW